MAIKFLRDYRVEGPPVETFEAGQIVERDSPESEMHFVRRGVAGFWDAKTKTLTDHEGRPIGERAQPSAIVHQVSNNRDQAEGRLPDGTAPRASGGPAVMTTEGVTEAKAGANAKAKTPARRETATKKSGSRKAPAKSKSAAAKA